MNWKLVVLKRELGNTYLARGYGTDDEVEGTAVFLDPILVVFGGDVVIGLEAQHFVAL